MFLAFEPCEANGSVSFGCGLNVHDSSRASWAAVSTAAAYCIGDGARRRDRACRIGFTFLALARDCREPWRLEDEYVVLKAVRIGFGCYILYNIGIWICV